MSFTSLRYGLKLRILWLFESGGEKTPCDSLLANKTITIAIFGPQNIFLLICLLFFVRLITIQLNRVEKSLVKTE